MTRNLKVLGLAVVAVCAMSAMMASAAQATPYWFKSDAAASKGTTLTGEQVLRGELPDEFTTTAGVVKCTTTHYETTTPIIGPTASTVTLHPTYSGCTAFGFGATVETKGCDYVFHVEESTVATPTIYHALTTIECEVGKEIVVVAKLAGVTKCTVDIASQSVGTVTLTNATKTNGVQDVHADININPTKAAGGISYKETAGTGAGACTAGSSTNGSYIGTATLTGFNEEGKETNIFLG